MRRILLIAMLLFAGLAQAQESEGIYEAALTGLAAITPAASPAPQGNAFCKERFGEWQGLPASVRWKIRADGSRQAVASLKGVETELSIATVPGSFMGFPQAEGLKPVDRIIFTIGADGKSGRIDVLLIGDGNFNCVLSNS
jgi:hypothetical protein